MRFLVDTNVLTQFAEPGHSMHKPAVDAIGHLTDRGDELFVVPQVLYEFWVVCTRPVHVNGLGKTAKEVVAELSNIKALFPLLYDTPEVFTIWERLVTSVLIMGKNAHDARLVAAMAVHQITRLLTFNTKDFQSYSGMHAVTPANVLES